MSWTGPGSVKLRCMGAEAGRNFIKFLHGELLISYCTSAYSPYIGAAMKNQNIALADMPVGTQAILLGSYQPSQFNQAQARAKH